MELEAFKQRLRILEVRKQGFIEQAEALKKRKDSGEEVDITEEYTASISAYEMEGRIKEMKAWIEWAEKYPAIDRPDKLPTTQNQEKMKTVVDFIPDREEAKKERERSYKQNAQDFVDMLPDAEDAE